MSHNNEPNHIPRYVVLGAVALTGLAIRFLPNSSNDAPTTNPSVDYTIRPGDTLWGIATHEFPGKNVANLVDQLSAHNSDPLQVGTHLKLPAGALPQDTSKP